jgi:hypothetical protein
MPAVNETIVREYFEALGFLVQQPNKHIVQARAKRPEEEIDFVVFNPMAASHTLPDRILWTTQDIRGIQRAVVSVRGWHTDRFSPAILQDSPEIFRFVDRKVIARAERMLGGGPVARILCVPAMPLAREVREQALTIFRDRGVEGVLPFRTLLVELASLVDVNCNYEKSDFLQALRILKNYDLIKDAQMELFGRSRKAVSRARSRASGPRTARPEEGDG